MVQRPELDAARCFGPGAEHGPALEVPAPGMTAQGPKVIPVEDDVSTGVLGRRAGPADLRVVGVLGPDLHADADRARDVIRHWRSGG